jgi:hypothetical protein
MPAYRDRLEAALAHIQKHEKFKELGALAEEHYPTILANPLEIVAEAIYEDAYTRFLGYLFDSEGTHELGVHFFGEWASATGLPAKFHSAVRRVKVIREWQTDQGRFVDLVLEVTDFRGNLKIVAIENKIWAKESQNQLSDYQEALSVAYKHSSHCVLVYLTPGKSAPRTAIHDHEKVKVVAASYSAILEVLQKLISQGDEKPIKQFMRQFAELIRVKLLGKGDAMEKAREIIRELIKDPATRRALDLIRSAYSDELTTRNLFYEDVQSALREKYPQATLAWHFPDAATRPAEFNFDLHYQPVPSLRSKGYDIYFMALVLGRPDEIPSIGDTVGTYIMAFKDKTAHNPAMRKALRAEWDDILKRLPAPMGAPREWGPWVCLWAGKSHLLVDMSWTDGQAIASNLDECIGNARRTLFVD